MALAPRLVVEVFEHVNYQGRKATIIASEPNTIDIGAQDVISSIKIYQGPAFTASPNYKAIFYEHANYNGRKLVLGPGFYPNIHEVPYNFGDIISSIAFSPAAHATPPDYGTIPVIIEAFRDLDFRGRKNIIMRDVSDLKDIGMDNVISSIRIQRGPNFPFSGCHVVFYDQPNFEGRRLNINLSPNKYRQTYRNLHDIPQPFSDLISSVKIVPLGVFRVLIVVGDRRTTEPSILESVTKIEGHEFQYTTVYINPNPNNFGDANNAVKLSSLVLSEYDIIWFTWNGPAHDREYFVEDAERVIKDFVRKGGIVWASAMDDNIVPPDGVHTHEPTWRGDWLPLDVHPIRVVNSSDIDVQLTTEGQRTGLFTWPNRVDVNALETDDHWVTNDPAYIRLAVRRDNNDAVGVQLRWGDGYYVTFAIDTRDARRASLAKTLIENALCYLASLAWQTSPRQPLKGRHRHSSVEWHMQNL
jgi:hypothetical protein